MAIHYEHLGIYSDLVSANRLGRSTPPFSPPGKVFDLTLPLEQVGEGYRAMDERRAIKTLLLPQDYRTIVMEGHIEPGNAMIEFYTVPHNYFYFSQESQSTNPTKK